MTRQYRFGRGKAGLLICGLLIATDHAAAGNFVEFSAPAGQLPATREIAVGAYSAAVLPNGRLITPAGKEIGVDAPKPFGLALSPDGRTLATINSGASRFSATLISELDAQTPKINRVNVSASFMGVVFSPDSSRFYLSGGENGNLWVGDTASGKIVGSVNLNGPAHPLDNPLSVSENPKNRFKGTFPGNLALSKDGNYLYAVDQGSFQVFVIDTRQIRTGTDADGRLVQPDNFQAVVGSARVGRYPFGIALSPDDRTLLVTHVGVFQYAHLRPDNPVGDNSVDYPLCYPGAGYPDETAADKTIKIKQVDPRDLPSELRDQAGIRCGYVDRDLDYKLPGLGSPNVPESSSVYVLDVMDRRSPQLKRAVKTGPLVGQRESGIETYSGSHPNAAVIGPDAIYVANGNNDSLSVLHPGSYEEISRIRLSPLKGRDRKLKGVQPVALALSPDASRLYVAEAGVNAVGVVKLSGRSGRLLGHIPVGWWPSSLQISADGKTLYVANARGRGAGPNNDSPPDNLGSPKHSVLGTVSIIPVPGDDELAAYTERVYANNGFTESAVAGDGITNPIPAKPGEASKQIKHVIFLNKENATHDLLLGDITRTRSGRPVNGEPRYSLGYDASPNHHELALRFAFSDNFYLEPSVSSDGHRWLTGQYTSEFEETHWPASYGGQRRDSGDDPEVIKNYPGRIGFTDANSSPEPNDYNQHGGIYLHLQRNGKRFVNFGNGYEFAVIEEPFGADPTGAREHTNVPMEKVLRDNSDHLYPTYNTHIPDAPLPEDPGRFSRFGRFRQVFEAHYVDRKKNECKLPHFVDLYYPNDHGGGSLDINPNGPEWSFKRFVQDNDAALGLTVELVSNSPCWKDTVIFVVEDDTQNGLDHVDGHRSIFMAISPWVKKQYVSKTHASLGSVFKTINRILGVPPLNQYDAAATDLRDLFTDQPDFEPYRFVPVGYAGKGNSLWTALSKTIDFSRPDADEVKLRDAIMKSEGLPRKDSEQ
jgi:DNA-binding beta-propeller fold protein YncE